MKYKHRVGSGNIKITLFNFEKPAVGCHDTHCGNLR